MDCKITSLLLLSFLVPVTLMGQNSRIGEGTYALFSKIDLLRNEFSIQQKSDKGHANLIQDFDAELVNGEIVFAFQLSELEKNEHYRVEIQMVLNDVRIAPEKRDFIGDMHEQITEAGQKPLSVTLINLLEKYPNMVGDMKLVLRVQHYAPQTLRYGVTCDEIPSFSQKQQMPYVYTGIAGAISLGVGQLLLNRALKDFDAHEAADEYEISNAFYDDYQRKANTAKALSYAGVAVLVADAVGYTLRKIKHNKRLKIYNQFCNPENQIVFRPYSRVLPGQQRGLGMKFTYTF